MVAPTRRPTEAWQSANLFELGLGHVAVSRFRLGGEAEVGVFLLDVHCLGVKNAFYTRLGEQEYDSDFLARVFASVGKTALSPACARRLVEDAVAYAQNLGFAPHPDYRKGCRVFGGIEVRECATVFSFGQNGKPLLVQGPNDPPEFIRRAMANLTARCGQGNFGFMVLADDSFDPGE
jgi:hypothetical protein